MVREKREFAASRHPRNDHDYASEWPVNRGEKPATCSGNMADTTIWRLQLPMTVDGERGIVRTIRRGTIKPESSVMFISKSLRDFLTTEYVCTRKTNENGGGTSKRIIFR